MNSSEGTMRGQCGARTIGQRANAMLAEYLALEAEQYRLGEIDVNDPQISVLGDRVLAIADELPKLCDPAGCADHAAACVLVEMMLQRHNWAHFDEIEFGEDDRETLAVLSALAGATTGLVREQTHRVLLKAGFNIEDDPARRRGNSVPQPTALASQDVMQGFKAQDVLSFMRRATKAERAVGSAPITYWAVKPSGDYHIDVARGKAVAEEFLAFLLRAPTNSNMTLFSSMLVAMTHAGRPEERGIMIGFGSVIGKLAFIGATVAGADAIRRDDENRRRDLIVGLREDDLHELADAFESGRFG